MLKIIAISGPVGVGKSEAVRLLTERFNGARLSTRQIIRSLKGCEDERGALQAAGDKLDDESQGAWVAKGCKNFLQENNAQELLIVDSARKEQQLNELRRHFGRAVIHVHLTASSQILEERYAARPPEIKEFATYGELRANSTEAGIEELARTADVFVTTDRMGPQSVAAYIAAYADLSTKAPEKLVDVIVGGQYGSEGKGNICAHLAPAYDGLIRVGGPNAGHWVADPKYKYVQLPSGTGSTSTAKIYIGAGATIWLPTILSEIADLHLGPDRLTIDPNAMIIEQADRDHEDKTGDAIGSTKQGVGVATARKILGRDGEQYFGSRVRLAKDVEELRTYIFDIEARLEQMFKEGKRVLLEGTQGTALSIHHGPYPMVTSRETTASGCLADSGISPLRVNRVIMVTRTYPIRVGGNSGPIDRPIDFQTIATRSGLPLEQIEKTEVGSVSGKTRRIGEFDWHLLQRSSFMNGATDIALTFVDYLDRANEDARYFEQLTEGTKEFIERVSIVARAPVSLISTRFHARNIIDRRSWK